MPYVRSRLPNYILHHKRGLGDTSYVSVPTPSGDYTVVADSSLPYNQVFDPNGNPVTDFSTIPTSVTNAINSAVSSAGGLFSAPAGAPSAVPSWVLPAFGIGLVAFFALAIVKR